MIDNINFLDLLHQCRYSCLNVLIQYGKVKGKWELSFSVETVSRWLYVHLFCNIWLYVNKRRAVFLFLSYHGENHMEMLLWIHVKKFRMRTWHSAPPCLVSYFETSMYILNLWQASVNMVSFITQKVMLLIIPCNQNVKSKRFD